MAKSPQWNSENIINEVSVDNVIFGFSDGTLMVLLYQIAYNPFKGQWALPGGHVKYNESTDDAAKRILNELTGIKDVYTEQLRAFGDLERVKKKRTITIVYFSLVNPEKYILKAGAVAAITKWFNVQDVPKLTYDHNLLLNEALLGLRRKVKFKPIGFELLPHKFTLHQLQVLYESIFGLVFDKPNFRRKILNMDILVKINEQQTDVNHRFPTFYKFDKKRYKMLIKNGFYFDMLIDKNKYKKK